MSKGREAPGNRPPSLPRHKLPPSCVQATMAPMTDNKKLIQDMYAAFGRGDLNGLLAPLSKDVDWTFFGSPAIPFAGTFRGPEGVQKFFGALMGTADVLDFQIEDFLADGDKVVVLGREKIKVKATEKTWETRWAHVFTVAGGKVASFREYSDSEAVAAAYRR